MILPRLSFISCLLSFCLFSVISAQFNIFDQFFGHHHQQQQQDQGSRGVDWLKQQYDAGINSSLVILMTVQCNHYVCPDTLSCVGSAKDCPCPFGQDKCELGKAGDYVCVSPVNGVSGCDLVMEYRKGERF